MVFSSIKIIEQSEYDNYTVIVTTNNFNFYEINLNINNDEKKKKFNVKVVRSFLRYESYNAGNQIEYTGNYIIIPL